jgi:hypothetical protein
VKIDVGGLTGSELSAAVDQEIEQFNEFFERKLGNTALAAPERAAIKTFVWWMAHRDGRDAV